MQDAEIGQRGFLLTGDESFLDPYKNALANLPNAFAGLTQAGDDRPYLKPSLAKLREVADQRLDVIRATIEERRAGNSIHAVEIGPESAGKKLMDNLRDLIGSMINEENRRLLALEAEAIGTGRWLTIGIWCVVVFVLALGAFAVFASWRQTAGLIGVRDALRRSNDELLAEATRREQVEEQLRQSQKMEAIGQLTGGIAHDFNNMLAVIVSSLTLMQRRMARGEGGLGELINAGIDAANRAASLTKRLLDFSRRQTLVPEPLDVNRLLAGMEDLLRRTLGGDIRLEVVLGGGLWLTHADPTQLENAILNVAVNGRDAMPKGGKITIETQNADLDDRYASGHVDVKPGQYVLVAVTDTGSGMPPEVIAKAFDPFFTTKEIGRGTGLGLSQVFGFTKQSGGHVKIYSELGAGTTVKLYLPRFFGAKAAPPPSPKAEAVRGGSGETVLVVEDEESVRETTVRALEELGYRVLSADGGPAALRLLDTSPAVALLLTDVVMPDMNGRQLVQAARGRFPNLKVLYTTGYTRNAIVHNGVLDADVQLLSKPFTIETLASKVRAALAVPDRV
jgi:signal transduction histidine kinase/ActR/RegA family two-component response regulator